MTGYFQQLFEMSEHIWRIILGGAVTLVILIVVLIGVAESNDSAENVFWAAVSNSMNTSALTVSTTGTASGTTENVSSQLDFGQHPSSLMLTTLVNGSAKAQTETLTTPTAEYVRYNYIDKVLNGKPVNFSSVLGVWAKTSSSKGDILPPTFPQILLDQVLPLPMGNLTPGQRAAFTQQMQTDQIYTVNFSQAKKLNYRGRTTYSYAVSIQPVLYLELVKDYAPDMYMHQYDQLNPNSYDGRPNVAATWTVDAKSKELVKVDYGNGRVQKYSGWDVAVTAATPKHTISSVQLQQRLNKLL